MGFGPNALGFWRFAERLGLNALTGIDGIWTYSTFVAPDQYGWVLMPLRALMGFGPIYSPCHAICVAQS